MGGMKLSFVDDDGGRGGGSHQREFGVDRVWAVDERVFCHCVYAKPLRSKFQNPNTNGFVQYRILVLHHVSIYLHPPPIARKTLRKRFKI